MEKKELLEINLDYLDKINIPDYKFGIEIEFSGALFNDVKCKLDEVLGYVTNDKEKIKIIEEEKTKYKKWRLVNDGSVQSNTFYKAKKGGEINSPIMRNEKKYWQELKKVCEMLKTREYIEVKDKCGIHIHTDMDIFNVIQEYKNLVKLFVLYEDIIYRFGYGETDSPRKSLLNYAKPFSSEYNLPTIEILKNIDNVETKEQLVRLLGHERKYGLNLTNIIKKQINENDIIKQTIEKRYYNSTLNQNIIQNNIRFDFCLLDYCKIKKFDYEFINNKIEKFKPIYINDSLNENTKKAEEFFNMICKDELDRLKLLKQYYKIYNKNDIEKTLHL